MSKYIFLITEKGGRTNICASMELISLPKLIEYLKEDVKTLEDNKNKDWREHKERHILNGWGTSVRVGKVDDKSFPTKILKYLTLEEFEEIFKEYIDDIEPLLEYTTYGDKYFRKDILNKYGIKKEY